MPPQIKDAGRTSRLRSNTTNFVPFNWRRGRTDPTSATAPISPPTMPLEALIEALSPPAVPSLAHARALCSALANKAPNPNLAKINSLLASLCSSESPPALQAAGYDILAAYWENNGAAVLTTADRLSCLSLFLHPAVPWLPEVWESRFKALVAIIQSGAETVGMESALLKVLRSWIEGAFHGLVRPQAPSPEEKSERERSVTTLTAFLTRLVSKPEFVSRLSEHDTSEVLELWVKLIDRALLVPTDDAFGGFSSQTDLLSLKRTSSHGRYHSAASIPQAGPTKHPADIIVDAYLQYLDTRLNALAPLYLEMILPLLFRALAFYATPLPRISLTPSESHQHNLEQTIVGLLSSLVTGPYSSTCTNLLKRCLFPAAQISHVNIQTTVGALKTLRASIRETLITRLARAYIIRSSSVEYSPAGAPTHLNLERELMKRAWSKDDSAPWDLIRFRTVLCRAVRAWADKEQDGRDEVTSMPKELVLDEIAAILKDVVQALDQKGESEETEDEEISAVGDILRELVAYVRQTKMRDGNPITLFSPQLGETSPFVKDVSALLGQDLNSTPLFPVLPSILLSCSELLTDGDTANLLSVMSERQSLTPTSPSWLEHWNDILSIPDLYSASRLMTRQVAMDIMSSVWEFVKDIPVYRKPLAEMIFQFWRQQTAGDMEDATVTVIWHILGDEVVLRRVEAAGDEASADHQLAADILAFLTSIAGERQDDDDDDDAASVRTAEISTNVSPPLAPPTTAATSPIISRAQSVYPPKERESTIPSVMSILSSLTSGNPARSQSQPPQSAATEPRVESPPPLSPVLPPVSKTMGAVVALVSIFSQLAFTALVSTQSNRELALRVFRTLIDLLESAECIRARLTVLQFMMRLRVDRDHRLYFSGTDYDKNGQIFSLATLISRVPRSAASADQLAHDHDPHSARARAVQERNGRRPSRGRGGHPSRIESRSRSRTAPRVVSQPASIRRLRARDPIWAIPETLPFAIGESGVASEGVMSYDPSGPRQGIVLPLSTYLSKMVDIIENEKEWEILSYVLCHLPTQLANKHLFCGPKSRVVLGRLLTVICSGIAGGTLAMNVERWPENIVARDAHGLAYHTLTVLISYKRCFPDLHIQHRLVEVFLLGLSGLPSTIKCCLHALSLSAFELQPSMTRYASRILEKLSQIMSNPAMAVDIINFLAIVGSINSLHANFTEGDYKMVFGVALQYLQHHNHLDDTMPISWALSQHVRIMSYYIVYLWFLAVRLADRHRHVKFISRQLLLANEGRDDIDEYTEVCFDWLARYTYASADPRPAPSMLGEIVMNPSMQRQSTESAISEKTWVAGNAVITIRTLKKRGWVEVLTRRSSGLTKFLCRAENVPMIQLGDVDPDFVSVVATLTLDQDLQEPDTASTVGASSSEPPLQSLVALGDGETPVPKPDPITGYVWSGTAPSQRRKDVAILPSYFALQLSSYPDIPATLHQVNDFNRTAKFFQSLDRMPTIDTHKVGIMYVAPGQKSEGEILRNSHGSPAYSRFLEELARLINLCGQVDVYAGGLDPDEDGEYAYAWWDDIGQILFHTATLMPSSDDVHSTNKKRHIGNDYVRIVWNDSGMPYRFDTLVTQFQFVNIVIEPHSRGAIAAFSNNQHENEYFKVIVQRAPGMSDFTPIGDFKLISAENLPLLVRQLSLLTDWFVSIFQHTQNDTVRVEITTNWVSRLQAIKRFRTQTTTPSEPVPTEEGVMGQTYRDFTTAY